MILYGMRVKRGGCLMLGSSAGWRCGRRGLSFKTSFSRDFMGSTRAGKTRDKRQGQGQLTLCRIEGPRAYLLVGVRPCVDSEIAIKLFRPVSLVEG